jgi:Flp pilus assembly protein TadG
MANAPRSRRGERGQGITELAMFAPITMFLMLGMVEIGRVNLYRLDLAAAAHAGVLYASQSQVEAADKDGIEDHVLAELKGLPDEDLSPTVKVDLTKEGTDGDGYGKQLVSVTVDMSVPALFKLPGLPKKYNLTVQTSARVLTAERRAL